MKKQSHKSRLHEAEGSILGAMAADHPMRHLAGEMKRHEGRLHHEKAMHDHHAMRMHRVK